MSDFPGENRIPASPGAVESAPRPSSAAAADAALEAYLYAVSGCEYRDASAEQIRDALDLVSGAEATVATCERLAYAAAEGNSAARQITYSTPEEAQTAKSAAKQRAAEAAAALEQASETAAAAQEALSAAEDALDYLKNRKSEANAAYRAALEICSAADAAKPGPAVDARAYDSLVVQFEEALKAHHQAHRIAEGFPPRLRSLRKTVQSALDTAEKEFSFAAPAAEEAARVRYSLPFADFDGDPSAFSDAPGAEASASFARTFAAALAVASDSTEPTAPPDSAEAPLPGVSGAEHTAADEPSGRKGGFSGAAGALQRLFRREKRT